MAELSDHTKLMNIMMGLALDIPKWSTPLKKLKYSLEVIEGKSSKTNPDLVFTNRKKNHSIIVDCKSKTLEEKQIAKYEAIKNNPQFLISSGMVDIVHQEHFKADPIFTSFFDISQDPLLYRKNFPTLHVIQKSSNIERIEKNGGNFQVKEVENIFPIDTSNYIPPYNLFPFGENDDEIFTIHIIKELLFFGLKKESFSMEILLESAHPYWKYIVDKKKFIEKATTLMIDLEKKGVNFGLSRYLSRDGKFWKVEIESDPKSVSAFQNICEKIIDSITYRTIQSTITQENI